MLQIESGILRIRLTGTAHVFRSLFLSFSPVLVANEFNMSPHELGESAMTSIPQMIGSAIEDDPEGVSATTN